jgi:hypothetical protein
MIAAATSPVSSYALPSSFTLPGRQHRQQMLDWDHDEPASPRRPASPRTAAASASTRVESKPAAGPRRMSEVMPDVLARYGLTL